MIGNVKVIKLFMKLALVLVWPISVIHAGDPFAGANVYSMHCISCHGASGRSNMLGTPSFALGSPSRVKPDSQLKQVIKTGKGVMPAYRGILSDDDIADVIAHIRTFM